MADQDLVRPRRSGAAAFALSDEQREILEQADNYARNELLPLQQRMDNEEWWPPHVMPALGRMGYLGVTVAPEFGGSGGDFFTTGLITQAFARWNPAISLSYAVHENLCLNNIYRNGNDDIRRRYMPRMCDGSAIGALGLTEPEAGSDALGSMGTTALRSGDTYLLNGRKMYITNGPIADVLLIYAKTDKSKGPKGISAFVVEKSFPGFQVAQKLDKMGFRGSTTARAGFRGLRRAGREPGRRGEQRRRRGDERARSRARDHRDDRSRDGRARLRPRIGVREDAQAVWARDRRVSDDPGQARRHVHCRRDHPHFLLSHDGRGERPRARRRRPRRHPQAHRRVHPVRGGGLLRVVNDAVQIHGGAGYMRETEINRLYRATKLLEIGAGTTEIRKLIIAGELMRPAT